MKTQATDGILQNIVPKNWKSHRFGLSADRWNYLKNKSFWVTGAGTGYGRCISIALAGAGATVFLTGRRQEKLLETINEMKSLNIQTDTCHILPADITDKGQIKEACKYITGLSDSLYGLINNAALPTKEGLRHPLQDMTLEDWNRIMQTNVTAPWLVTKLIFPHMIKGGTARILFITSEAGWAFTSGFGPYNVSKAALNSLTACIAEEYSSRYSELDLQINALVPGEARTEMNKNSPESPYVVVNMVLLLLSHPRGGPNGRFFHRDGRHLEFAYSTAYRKSLL
jgi:NAD(P)-dependent dehydrogenase (short-subunit alcohol dehydrogenase family)